MVTKVSIYETEKTVRYITVGFTVIKMSSFLNQLLKCQFFGAKKHFVSKV